MLRCVACVVASLSDTVVSWIELFKKPIDADRMPESELSWSETKIKKDGLEVLEKDEK